MNKFTTKSFIFHSGCTFSSIEVDGKIIAVNEFKYSKYEEKFKKYENLIASGQFIKDGESFDNQECEQCGDYNYSQKYKNKL